MSFVSSEQTLNNSPYETFKFEEVGDTLTFYAVNIGERSGEHGDFKVMEVVQWNKDAKTYDELKDSLKLVSFALKTWLSNAVDQNLLLPGGFYTITLTAKRDTKYTCKKTGGQKKTKSDNFKIDRLGLSDTEAINIIKSFAPNIAVVTTETIETEAPVVARPRV